MSEREPSPFSRLKSGPARTVVEIAVALAVLAGVAAYRERDLLATGSTPAPELALESLDGARVSLSSLRGKTVLLHFWATWCGVCRVGEGEIAATYAALGPDQALLAIADPTDDPATLRAYVAEHGLRYPVLRGTPEAMRAFRVSALPTDYVIGPDGMVRARTVGLASRLGLRLRMWRAR